MNFTLLPPCSAAKAIAGKADCCGRVTRFLDAGKLSRSHAWFILKQLTPLRSVSPLNQKMLELSSQLNPNSFSVNGLAGFLDT